VCIVGVTLGGKAGGAEAVAVAGVEVFDVLGLEAHGQALTAQDGAGAALELRAAAWTDLQLVARHGD
jgi:hypothetical protein